MEYLMQREGKKGGIVLLDFNSKPLCPEGPSRKNEGGAGAWESFLDLPGWGWKGQKFHKKGKEKPSWCPGLGKDAQMDVTCPGLSH